MEVSESPSTTLPPLITSPAAGTRQTSSRRTPTSSPKRLVVRDNKLRGTPPRSNVASAKEAVTTRSRAKSTRLAPGAARPIVPLTERRAHDERDKSPTNHINDAGELKWEVAPDGGSAGREGRQFTVANVGNNGKIYLRYVTLPETDTWDLRLGLHPASAFRGPRRAGLWSPRDPRTTFAETSQAGSSSRPSETPPA